MGNDTLARLRRAHCEAEDHVKTLRADREEFIYKQVELALSRWNDANGNNLQLAEDLLAESRKRLTAEVDRLHLASSASLLPYPEGTVVEEMRRPKHSFNGALRPTGKEGVLQIFRAGDKYPSNLGAYSVPDVGDVVVRDLKNDGTPGLMVRELCGCWSSWYKDGVMVVMKEKKEVSDAEV